MNQPRPLVSFILLCYKQENYIQQALDGVLSQTWQPLEIILSDDCSPDRTFYIMENIVNKYKGPHRIILNRNSRNLGIIGNVNRCVELSSGSLIVYGAGDDISVPDRTEKIVNVWQSGKGSIHLIHSPVREIMDDGTHGEILYPPPQTRLTQAPPPNEFVSWYSTHIGATAAWSRVVFEEFGPLPSVATVEDTPIFYRAALLGKVAYIDAPLVFYRRSGLSKITSTSWGEAYLHGLHKNHFYWKYSSSQAFLHDLRKCEFNEKEYCISTCLAAIQKYKRKERYSRMRPWRRFLCLPQAIAETLREKSAQSLADWMRYSFEPITILLVNRRGVGILSAIKRKYKIMTYVVKR